MLDYISQAEFGVSIGSRDMTGTLYIVATPIGNLDDMTPRAVDVLRNVNLILAEDTRHSKKLLQHFTINTPVQSCHDFNERDRVHDVIARLERGENIALISDAGTPLISDPGYRLVTAAHAANVRVSPVPGVSALIAALSVAGIATDRFTFIGYLPAKPGARRRVLRDLAAAGETLVLYETPHRICDTLADISGCLGTSREMTVCRELTKQFETVRQGSVEEITRFVRADSNQQKGEFVLVIQGVQDKAADEKEMSRVLRILLASLPVSSAAEIAADILGESKNRLYKLALKLKDE